jgi:hypothetical protein
MGYQISPQAKLIELKQKSKQHKEDLALKERNNLAKLAYNDYQTPAGMLGDTFSQYTASQEAERARTGRKKGLWENLTEGFSSGMAAGLKAYSKNEKVNRVLNYFNTVSNEAGKQLQWHEGQAQFNAKVQPFAQTAMQIMNSEGSLEMKNATLQKIADNMRNSVPDFNYEVAGVIPNTNQIALRDRATNEIENISLSKYVGQDFLDAEDRRILAEEQKNYERAKQNEQRQLEISEMNARNYEKQTNFQTNPEVQGNVSKIKKQIETNIKYINELQPKIERIDLSVSNLEEIKDIIEGEITEGGILSPAGGGLRGWAARLLGNVSGESLKADKVKMLLATEYARASEIVGGGARSDQDMKDFKETLADLEKNPYAAVSMLEKKIRQSQNQSAFYREQIRLYEEDPAANLQANIPNLAEDTYTPAEYGATRSNKIPQQAVNAKPLPAPQGYVNVKFPDGQVKLLKEDEAINWIRDGIGEAVE